MNSDTPTPRTDARIRQQWDGAFAVDCQFACQLEREVIELTEWKESAMSVWPPMQQIAKELGMPPGMDIGPNIIPYIKKLKSSYDICFSKDHAAGMAIRVEDVMKIMDKLLDAADETTHPDDAKRRTIILIARDRNSHLSYVISQLRGETQTPKINP